MTKKKKKVRQTRLVTEKDRSSLKKIFDDIEDYRNIKHKICPKKSNRQIQTQNERKNTFVGSGKEDGSNMIIEDKVSGIVSSEVSKDVAEG